MKTSELKNGYLVCREDVPLRIYDTLQDAEALVTYQRQESNATFSIVKVTFSDLKIYEAFSYSVKLGDQGLWLHIKMAAWKDRHFYLNILHKFILKWKNINSIQRKQ